MRLIHVADLHFGKSLDGLSLLENGDQGYWVDRFLEKTDEVRPDAVLIAGDVYDRGSPSGEAVALLSRLLTALCEKKIPVLMVAGNHDSAQRLAFASGVLSRQGIHISAPLSRSPLLECVTLQDEFGPVHFTLMPYVYPAQAGQVLDQELPDYDAAVRALLDRQPLDFSQRNVILAHQNVTASGVQGERGGSETMVGGVGQVDYTAFDGFDYAALGHIHAAYAVGRPEVRYAGSPLCYHFDETRQPKKGPLLVELGQKGTKPRISTLYIPPLHPMRELKGPYSEVRDRLLEDARRGEYLRIVLTDQRITPEISELFRQICQSRDSVLMELSSEYALFGHGGGGLSSRAVREKSVETLFADFYADRRGGAAPDERELELMKKAAELLRHADVRSAPDADAVNRLVDALMAQQEETR